MSFLTRTITVGVKGKKKNPISLRVKGAHILSVIFLSAFLIATAQPVELSGAFYDDSAAGSLIDSASPTRYKDNCRKTYPKPRIRFDRQDSEGRVYIPVVNWSAYANEMFRKAPDLPPCGTNTNSARTWVDIYDADTNKRVYGFCALGVNQDLKGIWFLSKAKSGRVYIILNDRACNKKYRSNTLKWGGTQDNCKRRYPNPRIRFDRQDSEGRVYIPVVNWSAYANEMFRQAPDLPPCGANPNSARTWVDIYDADTNKRIYGFCALGTNEDLKGIWFLSKAKSGRVYIILIDRACKKKYRSNTLRWGGGQGNCDRKYPRPRIKFDHRDSDGRVYIPVVNWQAYPNALFQLTTSLPPCGANPNASRTWVDIYDAATNNRIYGFCAFDSNDDLKGIWFSSKARSGRVYIILTDRLCNKKYRSNTIKWP